MRTRHFHEAEHITVELQALFDGGNVNGQLTFMARPLSEKAHVEANKPIRVWRALELDCTTPMASV